MQEKQGPSLRVEGADGTVWYARTTQDTEGKLSFKEPAFQKMAAHQRPSKKLSLKEKD